MAKDRTKQDPWSRRPEEMQYEDRVSLIRCPSRGSLKVTVLSHDIEGRGTHYWGGRTMPCRGWGCEACTDGREPRWLGWLAVLVRGTDQVSLLEMTKTNAALLDEQFRQHRTLRGLQIEMLRPSGKPNGRVIFKLHDYNPQPSELQKAPNVRTCLYKIWQLKPEDDHYFAPGPKTSHSEAEIAEIEHGLQRKVNPDGTLGNELPRRPRPDDHVRIDPKKNRGVPEITATPTTNFDPEYPTQPIQEGGTQMDRLMLKLASYLGESSEEREAAMHGVQPMDDMPSDQPVESSGHDHNSNGHPTT